jgi:hypothetical protein
VHIRHGLDGLFLAAAFNNENRKYQVICGQACFPHHAATKLVATHSAHACGWKSSIGVKTGHCGLTYRRLDWSGLLVILGLKQDDSAGLR